jgi:hypothetical protein
LTAELKGAGPLKSKTIDKVSREVYRKHPDLDGVKPKVTPREGASSNETLLVYQKKVSGPGGKSINRIVRAVVSEDGEIKKISTSK